LAFFQERVSKKDKSGALSTSVTAFLASSQKARESYDSSSSSSAASFAEEEFDLEDQFFLLLNHDPDCKKTLFDDSAIRQVIQDDPKVCKRKYKFDSVEESIYPLSMLCALGAELETIILAYEEYPQALTYSDDFIGTPLHYACAFQAPSKCVVSFFFSPCDRA
jgi:hypothetical protein